MHQLQWRHGANQEVAKRLLQKALNECGFGRYVAWEGYNFRVSAGPFGVLLKGSGKITSDAIVVESLSGLAAAQVIGQIGELLEGRLSHR